MLGGQEYQARYLIWNWHHGRAAGRIRMRDGDAMNCCIENLTELPTCDQHKEPARSCCPTCNQPVAVPTFDLIVQTLELPPLHQRILRAVWEGKGHPVMPGRIFDYMYEDDPDGGPSEDKMYQHFKVGMCRLRARLEGSGVSIENVGYRRGYRLVLEGKN